jgi:flagellar hook protein FlgE
MVIGQNAPKKTKTRSSFMSINSAMLAGVSGLVANSSAMAAISGNIANVNTTGYKRIRTDFTRLVNAQGLNTHYNAGGVTAATRQLVRNQGDLSATGVTTDIALQGQGFFVVKTSKNDVLNPDKVNFTRVGSFTPNNEGNLVNQSGHYLQGWKVETDGTFKTSSGDLGLLETVNLNDVAGTAIASTKAGINGNLRASQPVQPAEATYDAGNPLNNMASGAVRPDVNWSFQIYDSRGGIKSFSVALLKSETANEWHAEIFASDPNQINSGAPLTNGQIASGTLAFTPDGKLDLTTTSSGLTDPISIGAFAAGPAAPGTITWGEDTGIDAQEFALEIGQTLGKLGGITQFDSASSITSTTSDGALYGDVINVEVDREGFVSALFSNGATRRIYKLPVATFINPDGLNSEPGGAYQVSQASGTFNLKEAGTGGAALIESSALESSTVDLALEFTNMIITQRAYSASSKIITTADEMLDELIRMKR